MLKKLFRKLFRKPEEQRALPGPLSDEDLDEALALRRGKARVRTRSTVEALAAQRRTIRGVSTVPFRGNRGLPRQEPRRVRDESDTIDPLLVGVALASVFSHDPTPSPTPSVPDFTGGGGGSGGAGASGGWDSIPSPSPDFSAALNGD